ncbi:MAG: BREX system ATP-binding domain-containing protein [Acidobacteriota bacterium]
MNESVDRAESVALAQHILQRLGEGGQPPEFGVGRINVGNESYLSVLEREYFGNLLRFGSSFKLVQGYFGAGKTHFLYCVRERAWEHGFLTAVVELSPAECPYDDSLKVYRAVARRIGMRAPRLLQAPNYGIGDLVRNHVDDAVARASGSQEAAGPEGAARMVEQWLSRTVGRAPCESHSFRQAIVGLGLAYLKGDRTIEQRLDAWLLGEPIPPGELRDTGVYESLDKSNGFTMLRCLTQMAVGLGFPGTVLLFDEVDRNLSVGAKRSQAIGDNLRQVIDLCGRHQLPNTLFMYAVPPEFMRNIVPDYPALYQRLKSPVALSVRSPQAVLIDLERLDLEPAELLRQLGGKVVTIFEEARGIRLNHDIQDRNARVLSEAAVAALFEVNHRRLFVKCWVDFLHRQMAEGELSLSGDVASSLIVAGNQALKETPGGDKGEFQDF